MIRLWEIPPAVLLAGGPGLWPLAPLGNVNEAEMPAVMADLYAHWRTVPEKIALELANATEVLMGLRYVPTFIDQVLRRVESMEESTTYQRIIRRGVDRGRLEGKLEGKLELAHDVLLRQLTRRFGPLSGGVANSLRKIQELGRLERMLDAVLTVATADEILAVQ